MVTNDDELQIGLFDLAVYGVPIALVGFVYNLLPSAYLLPGTGGLDTEYVLVGVISW